jgi:cytochrome b561
MQLLNSQSRYGAIAQFLHWAVVALVVLAWVLGVTGDDEPHGSGLSTGLFVHITAGLSVIALTIARLLWRLRDPSPPPERTLYGEWAFAGWMGLGAKLAHLLLYGLLIAVPAAGIALQFARGESLPIFGIVDIASPWLRDRALKETLGEVHELLAHSLMAVAALHAAAALVHHWVFGDRTLIRMLPGAGK